MTSEIGVTVRYFAAARAAVGSDYEQLTMRSGTTVDDLVTGLADRNGELARVLSRCSFLLDGIAVRNRGQAVQGGTTVDVLPPFAGG